MNNEIWKPIPGYEGYEASTLGRIRSLKYGKIRILKLFKTKKGYLRVNLWKDGKMKPFFVHRLVYEAFNGAIPDGMQVNHINEDKEDNRYPENLNLMSCKENCNYGSRNKKLSLSFGFRLYQLTPDGQLVKEWSSAQEAGRNGFSQGCISECCNGKRKSHKGFLWVKKSPLS